MTRLHVVADALHRAEQMPEVLVVIKGLGKDVKMVAENTGSRQNRSTVPFGLVVLLQNDPLPVAVREEVGVDVERQTAFLLGRQARTQ